MYFILLVTEGQRFGCQEGQKIIFSPVTLKSAQPHIHWVWLPSPHNVPTFICRNTSQRVWESWQIQLQTRCNACHSASIHRSIRFTTSCPNSPLVTFGMQHLVHTTVGIHLFSVKWLNFKNCGITKCLSTKFSRLQVISKRPQLLHSTPCKTSARCCSNYTTYGTLNQTSV